MTINIKNFLNDKTKLSKMGEFQSLKQIEGLEMASISADLYRDGRDDLALFYFSKGANYATLTTNNSITSEYIPWNNNSHKKIIKGLLVNTKNANTFTGKQGKESIDILANSDEDIKESEKIDQILQPVHKSLFIESNPAPAKYAASLLGLCGDEIRLPLVKIKKETEDEVKKALSLAKLI